MTIPRRHHYANQPPWEPKEPASSRQEETQPHRRLSSSTTNEDGETQAAIRKFRLQPKTACQMIARSLAPKIGHITVADLVGPEDSKTRKIISARSLKRRFKPGATVYPTQTPDAILFVLDEGMFEIFFECDDTSILVKKVEKGAVLGEMPALGIRMFGTVALAAVPSKLSLLDLEAVKAIATKAPKLACEWLHKVAPGLAACEVENEINKHATLPSKITSLLLGLADETGAVLGLTEQAIADRTGARRESVVAAIAAMKRAGLVDVIGKGKILLTDIPALRKLKLL
jgi:CRP-like cAMP-binding protein